MSVQLQSAIELAMEKTVSVIKSEVPAIPKGSTFIGFNRNRTGFVRPWIGAVVTGEVNGHAKVKAHNGHKYSVNLGTFHGRVILPNGEVLEYKNSETAEIVQKYDRLRNQAVAVGL